MIILRYYLLASFFAVCSLAFSQEWNFGAEAGFVHNRLKTEDYSSHPLNGFRFGISANLTLPNEIAFESGISYIRKGGKVFSQEKNGMSNQGIHSIRFAQMDYIQLPFMIGYKINFPNQISIIPEAGAYFAVGINGDSFVTGYDSFRQPYESRVSTFSNGYGKPYRPCNRIDGGLSFALKLKWSNCEIKAAYDFGMTTVTYYGNGKQRTLSVTFGYWLFK